MLFRTRHVEDASRKIVETAEEEAEENDDEDEDDDGIEDQFVSLWLDVEDESSAVGGEGEVVWRGVGRGSCCECKRETGEKCSEECITSNTSRHFVMCGMLLRRRHRHSRYVQTLSIQCVKCCYCSAFVNIHDRLSEMTDAA